MKKSFLYVAVAAVVAFATFSAFADEMTEEQKIEAKVEEMKENFLKEQDELCKENAKKAAIAAIEAMPREDGTPTPNRTTRPSSPTSGNSGGSAANPQPTTPTTTTPTPDKPKVEEKPTGKGGSAGERTGTSTSGGKGKGADSRTGTSTSGGKGKAADSRTGGGL